MYLTIGLGITLPSEYITRRVINEDIVKIEYILVHKVQLCTKCPFQLAPITIVTRCQMCYLVNDTRSHSAAGDFIGHPNV